MTTVLGIIAFALYFLYDLNNGKYRIPRAFFASGTLLLAAATVADLAHAFSSGAIRGAGDILLLAAAGGALLLLIYCLFFALPFAATYTQASVPRRVCRTGAYALCRHPGILCFFALYLFLSLAALPQKLWINGAVFSLLNLAYAGFQDRYSFPKTFCDYSDYQKSVPFLIPTKKSIHSAFTKEDS